MSTLRSLPQAEWRGFFDRGVLPVAGAATVLLVASVIASVWPAARAAHVDVVQALRAE